MKLLLSADPSEEKVEEYLRKGETYTAILDNKVVGVYVLISLSSGTFELKNIAVDEQYQGRGIGKQLVLHAIHNAKEKKAVRIEVGTGNSSLSQLAFYQKCGFRISGVIKDFFKNNYQEEIIENGIPCVDMVRLVIQF